MWVIRLETHCDLQVGGRASWHLQFTATTGRGTAVKRGWGGAQHGATRENLEDHWDSVDPKKDGPQHGEFIPIGSMYAIYGNIYH